MQGGTSVITEEFGLWWVSSEMGRQSEMRWRDRQRCVHGLRVRVVRLGGICCRFDQLTRSRLNF